MLFGLGLVAVGVIDPRRPRSGHGIFQEAGGTRSEAASSALHRRRRASRAALAGQSRRGSGTVQRARDASINELWLDRPGAGIAHIPIERAMDILARTGLAQGDGTEAATRVPRRIESGSVHPTEGPSLPADSGKNAMKTMTLKGCHRHSCRVATCSCLADSRRAPSPAADQERDTAMSASIRSSAPRCRSTSGFATRRGSETRLGELLRATSGHPGPGLLPLPAALQPGPHRPDAKSEAALAERGVRLRRRGRELQPRGDVRARGAEEDRPTWNSMIGRAPSGAGISWSAIRRRSTSSARAVGFRYQYNPQTKLYAHAAGIVILTPDGRVARYFYGIEYPSKELRDELEAGGQRADRLADRSPAPVLLRLRRGDRQVHACRSSGSSASWGC